MVLKETVTIERPVDPRIADLVYFVRYVGEHLRHKGNEAIISAAGPIDSLSDETLIALAHSFWDRQHGED